MYKKTYLQLHMFQLNFYLTACKNILSFWNAQARSQLQFRWRKFVMVRIRCMIPRPVISWNRWYCTIWGWPVLIKLDAKCILYKLLRCLFEAQCRISRGLGLQQATKEKAIGWGCESYCWRTSTPGIDVPSAPLPHSAVKLKAKL